MCLILHVILHWLYFDIVYYCILVYYSVRYYLVSENKGECKYIF